MPRDPIEVSSRAESEELLSLDKSTLDPRKQYRLVANRPQRLQRMKAKGYDFVPADSGVKTLVDNPGGPDNRIYVADTVLMAVDKKRHNESRKRVADLARARLAAPKEQFRQKAKKDGQHLKEEVRIVSENSL